MFKDQFNNVPDCSEYIIAGFLGLICRLGLKGLIEEGIKDVFPTYNTMTGTGNINPTDNNNSGGNSSGSSSSPTSNATGVQKEEPLPDKGKNPEKANDSTTPNTGKVSSHYVSKRLVKVFDGHAERVSSEIKALSSQIQDCKDEKEKAFMEEQLDELFGQLTMLSKESAAESRKILSADNQNSTKRTSDSTVAQNASKKIS